MALRIDPGQLPEKVLQFGTGILLRGLPDYFIHKANEDGSFGGRVVVVKSTPGSAADFENTGGAFTTCIRGSEGGAVVEEDILNTSISRVLTAAEQWTDIVQVACDPEIQIIISNTTEVGIKFEPELIILSPPNSFPGKLTALLYERFRKLGPEARDLVVIPTELIPDNGLKLQAIVLQLVAHNKLDRAFSDWIGEKVIFCNSLVDRIVTRPSDRVKASTGNLNALTIQAEPYKLWAIEGGEQVKKICSFCSQPGVIIAGDIEYYRERKIRLLNGTHTISVCLGFLLGFDTVYECMQDREMSLFIEQVMVSEIMTTLSLGSKSENMAFAMDVLDRFRNPYAAHRLLSITLQATAKMKMRNVPTLIRYAARFPKAPDLLSQGFAAYLLFMKGVKQEGGNFFGIRKGIPYPIQDDQAGYFYEAWKVVEPGNSNSLRNFVRLVCRNTSLWDHDLTQLAGFADSVGLHLENLITQSGS